MRQSFNPKFIPMNACFEKYGLTYYQVASMVKAGKIKKYKLGGIGKKGYVCVDELETLFEPCL